MVDLFLVTVPVYKDTKQLSPNSSNTIRVAVLATCYLYLMKKQAYLLQAVTLSSTDVTCRGGTARCPTLSRIIVLKH